MVLISSLITTLLIPMGLPYCASLGLYLAVLLLIAMIVGTVESAIARFRMTHIFEFVFSMTAVALVILALVTIRIYGG